MKMNLPLGWLLAVLGGLTATGCIASPEDENNLPDSPPADTEAISFNAISFNAISFNAISFNALTVSSLLGSPLTQSALGAGQPVGDALADPSARQLLTYIVSCALPKGATLNYSDPDGNPYVFEGELGLASEWGKPGGSCNETCQQWVSGCVIARVNYLGQHVPISLRGQNVALKPTWQEMYEYPNREATFYGNIFSQPQRLLGCLSPGKTNDPRVCGPSIANCGIQFQGSCDQVCGAPRTDGSFPICLGPSDHVEGGITTRPYFGTVTVFTK